MATPNVSGYEQLIASGALVNAITNHSGFLYQINQILTFNADVCNPDRIPTSQTYYFNNDVGNDATGAGTSGSPYKTLGKAVLVATLANAAASGYRLRFARGVTWNDPTGLTLASHYHPVVDDYGNPAAAKPCFNALLNLEAFTNSTLIVSGVYRTNLAATAFSGQKLEWVVEGSNESVEFFTPYREYNASGLLYTASSGSFFWASGSNLLYVKPFSPIIEESVIRGSNTISNGVLVQDGSDASGNTAIGLTTIKNIRVQGYGVDRTNADVYGIRVKGANTEVLFDGVESYYSRFHNIGHVSQGGSSLARTRTVYKDCTAGYCLAHGSNASVTLFVDYNNLGNHEVYYIRNRVIGGGVLNYAYIAAHDDSYYGTTAYAHSNGPATPLALAVALNCVNAVSGSASGRPCVAPITFGDLPPINSGRHGITNYRGYIVNDRNPNTNYAGLPNLPNTIYYNGEYYHQLRGQSVFPNHSMVASGGKIGTVFDQCKLNIDIDRTTQPFGFSAMFTQAGRDGDPNYDHGVTFSNNHIHIARSTPLAFSFGDAASTGAASFHGNQLIVDNNLFTTSSSGASLFINMAPIVPNYGDGVRPTGGYFRNAHFGWSTINAFDAGGFTSATNQTVALPTGQTYVTGTRPLVGNPAYRTASGVPGTTFTSDLDFAGNVRASLYSIGPYEEAPYPSTPVSIASSNNTVRSSTTLTFDDTTAFGVSGYVIERTINGVLTSGFLPYSSGERFVANFGLAGGDFNSYRVATINENGEIGPYSSALPVTVPYAEGIQKIHAGGRNDNTAKYSTLRGSVSARHVAKSDLNGDNSKLSDRVTISSGTYRTGAEYNQSVTTTNYQILAGSGDIGKSAEPLHYRVGINRIKKNI